MNYLIEKEENLIEALQGFFPESSKRTLQNWIKAGRVRVDEKIVSKPNLMLKKGQKVSLAKKADIRTIEGIPLIYQDRWMVVIDKPVGLLSVPSETEPFSALTLLRLGLRTPSIFPVHRIDQDTSGVLLFARGKRSETAFDKLFASHSLEREYYAIVEGHLSKSKGTWESYLKEKENYDVITVSAEEGRRAVTHYEVLRRSPKFSFLLLKLETGRKHQIRVHCKEAGHPILGDFRYGSTADPAKRLCLHAHALRFIHPFTKKSMTFTAPLPKEFNTLKFPTQN